MSDNKNFKTNNGKVANIIGIVASSLLMILSFCGRYFNGVLREICNFFVGTFGMSFFGMAIAVIVFCSFSLSGKKITVPTKYVINFAVMYLLVTLLVHIFTTRFIATLNYQEYAGYCYNYYLVPTFGGVFFGTITYGLESALHVAGTIIILVIGLIVTVLVAGSFAYDVATHNVKLYSVETKQKGKSTIEPAIKTVPVEQTTPTQSERDKAIDILFGQQESAVEVTQQFDTVPQSKLNNTEQSQQDTYSQPAETILFASDEQLQTPTEFRGSTFFAERDQSVAQPLQQTTTSTSGPQKPVYDDTWLNNTFTSSPQQPTQPTQEQHQEQKLSPSILFEEFVEEVDQQEEQQPVDFTEVVVEQTPQPVVEESVEDTTEEFADYLDTTVQEEVEDIPFDAIYQPEQQFTTPIITQESSAEQLVETSQQIETAPVEQLSQPTTPEYTVKTVQTPVNGGIQMGFDIVETAVLQEQEKQIHQYLEYQKPPFELLNDEVLHVDNDKEIREEYTRRIVSKLAVYGIKVESVGHIVGPTVTRYQFKVLSEKTRMGDFIKYSDDLKACLESQYDLVIQAPVPGTSLVGIEVPNKTRTTVMLRPILESDDFQKAKGELVFAVGREISGKNIVTDLAAMPHLLVAGASGSGKSIALHNIIVSLMYKYSPEYVRFILADPKVVEMAKYNGSPHMLTDKVLVQTQDIISALDYLINEMEARYLLLAEKGVSKISEYNAQIDPKYTQKLPYIVLVVEELADLMTQAKSQVENKLVRLAQKARAAGIHLILATQRPSVDVVTGLIKANISCRMALNAASADDSRTMLGGGGAEKLLKRGDMLLIDSNSPVPTRVQGAYLSNEEIKALVEYVTQSNEVYYPEEATKAIFEKPEPEVEEAKPSAKKSEDKANVIDPLCKRALRYWLEKNAGKASLSSIQRSLGIGFNRAGKIFETLISLGYVEEVPANESGNKPRKVLVTLEQLDELFPELED